MGYKTASLAIALFTTTLLLAAAPASAATEYITNGGFDTDATGWTPVGNDASGGYKATTGGSPSFSGNPSGFFLLNAGGARSSDPSIAQTITGLTVGQDYVISGERAWAHTCCGSSAALSFGVAVDGTVILELDRVGLAHGTWTPFSVTFTATATSHTITFTGERNGDDSSYGIDNISVTEAPLVPVPELGTLVLVATGLLGVLALVVARRRS